MTMLRLLIVILLSTLICYELNKLIRCFLKEDGGMRGRIFYIIVNYAMFHITFFYQMDDYVVIICFAVGLCLMEINITASMKEKVMCFIYSFIVLSAIQLAASIMMKPEYYITDIDYALRQLIISTIQYCLIGMMWRKKKIHTGIQIPIMYWILFLLVPICSMYFIAVLSRFSNISTFDRTLGIFGILVVNYVVIELFQALSESYQQLLDKRIYEEQSRYYEKQLKYITESYQTVRSAKHDIKNVLNAIKTMITEKKYQEIVSYIDNVNKSAGFNTIYVDTGISAIDGMLNYQIQRAKNVGIEMVCKVSIPEELDLNEIDMGVLLGNIIDNAIEATSKIKGNKEKKIDIHIKLIKQQLFINVTNPYEGLVLRDRKGNIKSTKADTKEHGIGLSNVEKVLDKYHGEMLVNDSNQCFRSEIMLYLE